MGQISMILEAVPNISEGRNLEQIASWARWWEFQDDVDLLDHSADPDHHRSVFTLVGERDRLIHGLVEWLGEVLPSIDLQHHAGVHPRIGAADVVPLVPLGSTTMAEAVQASHELAAAVAKRHCLPVFLYGRALDDDPVKAGKRARLAQLRRGGLEALNERIDRSSNWQPDYGGLFGEDGSLPPQWGASAVGARGFLVACNVLLSGGDVLAARSIARSVRQSNGGLPGVQAIGLYLASQDKLQVSMNLVEIDKTSVPRVVAEVERLAKSRSLAVDQVELIGLVPRAALDGVPPAHFGWSESQVLETGLEECGWLEAL